MYAFLINPGVSLAIKIYVAFFSSSPLYPSEYSHMLQVSINYCGISSCNECIYIPVLNGTSVNYSGNSLCDECTYQPYMECQEFMVTCVFDGCTCQPYIMWSVSELLFM